MSSWVALNIEPDEAIEEEVDDTKEIQIEEALKLYQNALKLHSQGPQFYPEAAEAYDALLKSEIFKYPESISDYKRNVLHGSDLQVGADEVVGGSAAEPLVGFDTSDSTSSILLQTIYLSYKNHGQYILDSLRAFIQSAPPATDAAHETSTRIANRASEALGSFAEALERDDTDLNLWRQSARLCSVLQSYRLARYCLESVLADDENRLEVRAEQLGLEETFAEERLRETLLSLDDAISVTQVPLRKPKKALLKFLKTQSDPYPFLPALPNKVQDVSPAKSPLALHTSRHEITVPVVTWAAVGKSILQALLDEDEHNSDISSGTQISFSLPALNPQTKTTTTREPSLYGQSSKSPDEEIIPVKKQDNHRPEGDSQTSAQANPPVKLEAPEEQTDDHSSIDQRAEKQLIESLEVQSSHTAEAANRQDPANADEDARPSNPPRKRSSASAINEDQAEGIRAKSRRTRLRESNADASLPAEDVAFDQTKYYEDQLEVYIQADDWMFETVNSLLLRVGIGELVGLEELRKLNYSPSDGKDSAQSSNHIECLLHSDLKNILKNWDEAKSQAILQGDNFSALQDIQSMGKSGLAIFLEHSRKSGRKLGMRNVLSGAEELLDLLNTVNEGGFHIRSVSFEWLKGLLMPEYGINSTAEDVLNSSSFPAMKSTYTLFQWPSDLKEAVVQIILREDEYTYKRLCDHVEELERQILCNAPGTPFSYTLSHFAHLEMIETIYELHFDVYSSINNPNSEVNSAIQISVKIQ
ncbi:hypothetical protein EYZ11_005229 [Aspergillus tanneri]|uniref:Histone transcription regulator 3 homolog n=1 Tax=Aspergillus tanneri TaxID=1220188 RepID=A0A4V3UPJ1_9EURO|nr:hypothetical protein EYZ11_005229 [Aspergillus tanneri]